MLHGDHNSPSLASAYFSAFSPNQRVFMNGLGTARPSSGQRLASRPGDEAVPAPVKRLHEYTPLPNGLITTTE